MRGVHWAARYLLMIPPTHCALQIAPQRGRNGLVGPHEARRTGCGLSQPASVPSRMGSKSCHKACVALRLRKAKVIEPNTPIKIAAVLWITCVYYPCGYSFRPAGTYDDWSMLSVSIVMSHPARYRPYRRTGREAENHFSSRRTVCVRRARFHTKSAYMTFGRDDQRYGDSHAAGGRSSRFSVH